MPDIEAQGLRAGQQAQAYADYIEWRADNPSDDLMTQLLQAEFEDLDGQTRRFTREEVLNYVNLLAAAGNETTTRLIGWAGKVLAEHSRSAEHTSELQSLMRTSYAVFCLTNKKEYTRLTPP